MIKKRIVMCPEVSSITKPLVGAVKQRCSECGVLVWVNSSTLILMHDIPDMLVTCSPCVSRQMLQPEKDVILHLTAEQHQKLIDQLKYLEDHPEA